MSVFFGAIVLKRIGAIYLPVKSTRHISWMPFEQPDPSLYAPPPSLQPKRPLTAEAISPTTGKGNATTAKPGTVPLPPEESEPSKPPPSVPASAMATGPTPLSQIQKRSFSSSPLRAPSGAEGSRASDTLDPKEKPGVQTLSPPASIDQAPTLHLRMQGHPATWPVNGPAHLSALRHGDTWTLGRDRNGY